jgi:hypothetical protein
MATAAIIQVPNAPALRQTIDSYIVQGYSIAMQDSSSATMVKKKEFSIVWAVIGFFLCLLPFLIYCIVYATQKDQMVRIVIGASAGGGLLRVSADGNWWWSEERQNWVGVLESLPAGTQVSGDRKWWWDGGQWRGLPAPTDRDRDARLATGDGSDAPAGVSTPDKKSDPVEPRPGEQLPPPPGF